MATIILFPITLLLLRYYSTIIQVLTSYMVKCYQYFFIKCNLIFIPTSYTSFDNNRLLIGSESDTDLPLWRNGWDMLGKLKFSASFLMQLSQ